MKRIAFVAAALVLAACSAEEKAPAADTSAAAAAPAPEMAAPAPDTMAKPDSAAMMAPPADTTKH
jgi:uncharacterized lipoprotein